MRGKRRGARFTWMPMLGSRNGTEGTTYDVNNIQVVLSPSADPATTSSNESAQAVSALVPDFTQVHVPGSLNVGESLRDYTEGQDWFLRRIVGKIGVVAAAFDTTITGDRAWQAVLVTAGFFVGRAKEDAPALPDYEPVEMDPQALDNIRQPWIWRRTWWLACSQVPTPSTGTNPPQFSGTLPNSNEAFGSMADGPHVDAKTLRRIRRFERLWFTASVVGCVPGFQTVSGQDAEQPTVSLYADLRCLGGMRKSNNRSTF